LFNPYEVSALAYFGAGFSPLPASGKLLAVKDASGRHPLVNITQINKWLNTHKSYNVALRLPPNVIALDIDAYKGDLKRLEEVEAELGQLPITWNSDSRGGKGGKLLYRIPKSVQSKRWRSNINGITIIQHTHRYVMVLPSYNRESESRYMWYQGLGGDIIPDYSIPSIDDIAELPIEWALALKKDDQMVFGPNSEVDNFGLEIFNDDQVCTYMSMLMDMCKEKLIDSYETGLHDTGISVIFTLLTAAVNGHAGVSDALDELSQTFCSATRPRDLGAEWNALLEWALANIPINETSQIDVCELDIPTFNQVKTEMDALLAEIAFLVKRTGISEIRAIRLLRGKRGRLM